MLVTLLDAPMVPSELLYQSQEEQAKLAKCYVVQAQVDGRTVHCW